MFEKKEIKVEKQEEKKTTKKKTVASVNNSNSTVTVSGETRKKLDKLIAVANKSHKGKVIRPNEILEVALDYVTEMDIKKLQEKAVKGIDIIEELMSKYVKQNGKVTRDEFLKVLGQNNNLGLA